MAAEKELLEAIEQMKQGKEEGFNTLYSYTYNYVYSRSKYFMNNKEEDALDLTQETYVQAYRGIHNLKDPNSIYAWLGAIAYRQSQKMHNKANDILVNEEAEGIFEDIECTDKDFQPDETVEEQATVDIIKGMINELPALQREAIMAFYYDRMKIDEIAELFECSSNTIKSRLNYAKKFLKDKVEEHERIHRYRLHTVNPAVIFMAFKSMLAGKEYTLSKEAAQGIYHGIETSLQTGAVELMKDTISSEGISQAENVMTGTSSKVGMSIGKKIILGIAAVATVGAVVAGGLMLTNPVQNETSISQNELMVDFGKLLVRQERYVPADGTYSVTESTYEFDESGNVLSRTNTANGVTGIGVYEYEKIENGMLVKIVDEENQFTIHDYYDTNGTFYREEIYVANALSTVNEHNADGDRTLYIHYTPEGEISDKWEFTYDDYGNKKSESYINPRGESSTIHTYEYDGNGRIKKSTLSNGLEFIYSYDDAKGMVTKTRNDGLRVEEIYDKNENLLYSVTYSSQGVIENRASYQYDEDGYLIEEKEEVDGELVKHIKYTYQTIEELMK